MSESAPKPRGGSNPEAKILIGLLLVCVIAAVGFRYQLNSDRPQGDPEFIRQKVSAEDMPSMEGNMPSAPPI